MKASSWVTESALRLSRLIESATKDINNRIQELRAFKLEHSATIGYHNSPGGILNAYREGDISFDDAVAKLQMKPVEISRVAHVCNCGSGDPMPCSKHGTQAEWDQFDAEVESGIHK